MISDDINNMIIIDCNIFNKEMISNNKRNIDKLLLKKQDLLNKFKCFTSDYQEKKYIKHYEKEKKTNKLHIIPGNCTDVNKFKKDFTGMINKLTSQNKQIIFPKINGFITNIVENSEKQIIHDIISKFLRQSHDKVYTEILFCFDSVFIENNIKEYVKNQLWKPSENILNNDMKLSSTNEASYELYCQYVKWKKETLSYLIHIDNILSQLNKYDIIVPMMMDFMNLIKSVVARSDSTHILDFILEEINIFKKNEVCKNLILYIKDVDILSLKSSSKFLIMNILE